MEIPEIWSFESDNVAEGFDAHVRGELPWYDLATWSVATFAGHFIPENGIVYDIGASTGNIGRAISDIIKERSASLYAIESESSMQEVYSGGGEFILADALDYEYKNYDFACVFLTMMFLPIARRKQWLMSLIENMNEGGALVIFDKLEQDGGFVSTATYRMTLEAKINAGVDLESIIKKEISLKGIQRPLTKYEIPVNAKLIFKFGDFAGWVITK